MGFSVPAWLRQKLRLGKGSWFPKLRHQYQEHPSDGEISDKMQHPAPVTDADYPSWPPAPPQEMLARRQEVWSAVKARRFAAPRGYVEDQPLFALYRLYEFMVLDKVTQYRDQLERFWRQDQWPVCDIPDPADPDSARYAFLAGITYLMVRSFNARVRLGLTRDAHPIMLAEEAERTRNVPDELRPYETPPEWAKSAPPLKYTLKIPTEEGEVLEDRHDDRADPDFLGKNILLWTPHIYFT